MEIGMSNRNEALQQPPETILGRCARPRPKLICINGRVIGDAVVIVSPRDPNWYRRSLSGGFDGEITVKRPLVRRV